MSPETQELEQLQHRISTQFVKAFATFQLIEDNDHILVGLSGGKDSLCLLEMLAQRSHINHPKFKVEAIHVRMQNISYETSTDYLERYCADMGVKLHVVSTSFDIGEGSITSGRDARRQKAPCFLCSWNRRKQMFNLAQQLGCNKIALGHHQDDILHTTLMNLIYQGRFGTMTAKLQMRKMPLSIIRPLCMVNEADIRRYAKLRGYEQQIKRCPYEHDSHRFSVIDLFHEMKRMNPEIRQSIWNALVRDGKLVEE